MSPSTLRPFLVLCCCLPAMAVDSLKDTTFGLLFRPGIPKGNGQVTLFYDHTGRTGFDHHPWIDEDYEQRDVGALVVGRLLGGESWIVRGYAGARHRALTGEVVFTSGLALPGHIDQLAVGTSGKRQFGRRGAMTWRLGVNSTSDEPYHSTDEIGIEAELLYMGYRQNQDAWVAGTIWSSYAEYPIPILAYIWKAREDLTITIGAPMVSVRWQPAERWTVSGRAVAFAEDASLSIGRGFGDQLKVGAQYELTAKVYRDTWDSRPVERIDPDHELSFKEWRAGLAGTWRLGFIGSLDLEGGLVFNRKLQEKDQPGFFSGSDYSNVIRIEHSWYVRAKAGFNF